MTGRIIALILGIGTSLFFLGLLAAKGGGFGVVISIEFLTLIYGIALYGFLHYRIARQDELRDVLSMAAETRAPLAGAIWAYAEDRPRGWFRATCEVIFTNLLVFGSYWSWHRDRNFDRKAARLASDLEAGLPLSQAMRRTPGVASSETMLAVAVGESTGDLAKALRDVSQTRIASVVVEILPRLVYPCFILLMQILVIAFLMTFIVPKFERIMTEFRMPYPPFVAWCVSATRGLTPYLGPALTLLFFTLLWMAPMLIVSPGFRWWFPGVGYFERRISQGRLLKMLGMLLAAGKTAPQALQLIGAEDYLGNPVRRRVAATAVGVEAGQPLAEQLTAQGLMPKTMAPLLHAGERARNLPWAMEEAGDTIVRRTRTTLQRFSTVLAPLLIAIVGALSAAVALCVFLTIINIFTKLAT